LRRRFTFGPGGGFSAVWSPDGRRLVYSSRREGRSDLFQKAASGIGPEELVFSDDTEKYALEFSPDGRFLIYMTPIGATSGKLYLLPLTGNRKPVPFLNTATNQVPAAISPDGRWMAYVSDETSRREVYVTSFPRAEGKWQVSTNGGDNPRWRRDGTELFFTAPDRMMAVTVATGGDRFDSGPVRPLFEVRVPATALGTRSPYAVAHDAQRFLVNTWDPRAALSPISVLVNWPAALKR
jgi:Tol biopolymer transport system component